MTFAVPRERPHAAPPATITLLSSSSCATAARPETRDHGLATATSGKARSVRVVITGATGNVGTSLVEALGPEPEVDSVLGIARRAPSIDLPKVESASADITEADLVPLFAGADALVHLGWVIQSARRPDVLHAVNVGGTGRVGSARRGVASRRSEAAAERRRCYCREAIARARSRLLIRDRPSIPRSRARSYSSSFELPS